MKQNTSTHKDIPRVSGASVEEAPTGHCHEPGSIKSFTFLDNKLFKNIASDEHGNTCKQIGNQQFAFIRAEQSIVFGGCADEREPSLPECR